VPSKRQRSDVPVGQPVQAPAALRRWLTAYGAATATTAAYDVIRDAATPGQRDEPAKATALAYRDALERLWILDPLPAWLPTLSHLRRLGSAPRHHLADPALAARLLGVEAGALLEAGTRGPLTPRDGTLLGQLFESLVTLDVRVYSQAAEARVGHRRRRRLRRHRLHRWHRRRGRPEPGTAPRARAAPALLVAHGATSQCDISHVARPTDDGR
jgi:hypothetical protein